MREAIAAHFNKDELRVLCHDIGINAEDLPHNESGVSVWALELVEYAQRTGRMSDLLGLCEKRRPNVAWDLLLPTIMNDPTQNAKQASTGFTALYTLMQQPHVASLVGGAKSELRHTFNAFINLTDFKDLHDLLHQLQYHCYNFLARGEKRYTSDPNYREELPNYINEFQRIVFVLHTVVARPNSKLAYEKIWVQSLTQTHNLLRNAIETDDIQDNVAIESLKHCSRNLKSVISRQQPKLNAYIINTAHDIQLQNLIIKLNTIYNNIQSSPTISPTSTSDESRKKQFGAGITALSVLTQQLTSLIALHDHWQNADDILRDIERNPLRNLMDEDRWQDIWQIVLPLCEDEAEDGYKQAKKTGESLDKLLQNKQALSDANQDNIERLFKSFRSAVGTCFYQVDFKLKSICTVLSRDIQPQLNQVLELID